MSRLITLAVDYCNDCPYARLEGDDYDRQWIKCAHPDKKSAVTGPTWNWRVETSDPRITPPIDCPLPVFEGL